MFRDRRDAGRRLAGELMRWQSEDPVVLALPRGGVAVASEIADALAAPLDLVLVRKIGVEYQPELAAAAVVDGDEMELVRNEEVIRLCGVTDHYLQQEAARQVAEIERRRKLYLRGRPSVPLGGRTALVVDDGIATGTTVRVALKAVRRRGPRRLVLAVPVAPAESLAMLRSEVDELVCLETPEPFVAIGRFYDDFTPCSDDEVRELMERASARRPAPEPAHTQRG